jgi:hypothetical protein
MNTDFISRSGTRHIIGPSDVTLHRGRLTGLCGFSQSPDEETHPEAVQECDRCREAEERAKQIAQAALAAQIAAAAADEHLEPPQEFASSPDMAEPYGVEPEVSV